MGKRPRRTPAEKARAQYTNYAVKEPMELMEFLAAKMPDASRTKLKSLLSKRVVFVDNVITTQFNFPLEAGMKVQISKQKGKKEFNNRLLKIVYEDAYIIVVEKMQGLLSVNTERQKERTAYTILPSTTATYRRSVTISCQLSRSVRCVFSSLANIIRPEVSLSRR